MVVKGILKPNYSANPKSELTPSVATKKRLLIEKNYLQYDDPNNCLSGH